MDCQKLREDIDGLIEQKGQYEALFEAMHQSGKGKAAVIKALEQASNKEDELFLRYMDDFYDKLNLKLPSSESFHFPFKHDVEKVEILSDGSIVASSSIDGVYLLSKDEATEQYTDGHFVKLELGERLAAVSGDSILVRDVAGMVTLVGKNGEREQIGRNRFAVRQSAQLDNGDILLCDNYGNLNFFTKRSDGKFSEGQSFAKTGSRQERNTHIAALPEGGAVICEDGLIRLCTRTEDGQYILNDPIERLSSKVTALEVSSNGDIYVALGDTLRVLQRWDDGDYSGSTLVADYHKMAEESLDGDGWLESAEIVSMCPGNNGDVLVSCTAVRYSDYDNNFFGSGDIRVCRRQDDGGYNIDREVYDSGNQLSLSGVLPDGRIIASDFRSVYLIGNPSLDDLKKDIRDMMRLRKKS